MPTYRAYALNHAGRITWGDWIQAADLDDARRQACELCDDAHPKVELWDGPRKLAEVSGRED